MSFFRFPVPIFFYLLLVTGYSYSRINFIHIPKCGGSTVHTVFEKFFSLDEIYDNIGKKTYNEKEFEGKLFVSGHIPYWFFKTKDDIFDSSINITILRDPISRYLSNVRYLRLVKPNTRIDEAPENMICRLLCSDPHLQGEALLHDCIQTLHSLDFIIFMDDLQEDLTFLINELGFQLFDTEIPCINKNNFSNINLDENAAKVVIERNKLDIELYKYALENFRGRNNVDLKKKKLSCPSLKRLMRKRKTLNYTFDLPLPGAGWHHREYIGTGMPIKVWIRGNEGKIYFNLNSSNDYTLQFQAEKLTHDIDLTVKINGHPLNPRKLNNGYFSHYGYFSLYGVTIPKEYLNDGLTEISFVSSHSYVYSNIFQGSLDKRSLSIALNLIRIFRKINKKDPKE